MRNCERVPVAVLSAIILSSRAKIRSDAAWTLLGVVGNTHLKPHPGRPLLEADFAETFVGAVNMTF